MFCRYSNTKKKCIKWNWTNKIIGIVHNVFLEWLTEKQSERKRGRTTKKINNIFMEISSICNKNEISGIALLPHCDQPVNRIFTDFQLSVLFILFNRCDFFLSYIFWFFFVCYSEKNLHDCHESITMVFRNMLRISFDCHLWLVDERICVGSAEKRKRKRPTKNGFSNRNEINFFSCFPFFSFECIFFHRFNSVSQFKERKCPLNYFVVIFIFYISNGSGEILMCFGWIIICIILIYSNYFFVCVICCCCSVFLFSYLLLFTVLFSFCNLDCPFFVFLNIKDCWICAWLFG